MEISHGTLRADDFERRLRAEVDPNLRLRFNDRRQRWVIYRVSHLTSDLWEPIRILENQETGEFIPLDCRIIEQAIHGDTWRRARGVDDILDEIQVENDKKRRSEEKRVRSAAEDAATYVEAKMRGRVTSLPKAKPAPAKPGRIIIARR